LNTQETIEIVTLQKLLQINDYQIFQRTF